jgi:hypothetical protein
MKPKLLVVLGAGSSISLGMPSVSELDNHMAEWAQAWAQAHGFPDYYAEARKAIEVYYNPTPAETDLVPNFEKVLSDLLALGHWMTPSPWGDTLRQIACGKAAPPNLDFPNPLSCGPAPYGPTVLLNDQLTELLLRLARHMRERSRSIDFTDAAARQYVTLFHGLRDAFDVGVYNLNYDAAALMALEGANTGFGEDGVFYARGVHARREWGFVYHLHGSVHHTLAGPFSGEIRWQDDLNRHGFIDGHHGTPGDKRSDGRSFPLTTLVAGGFKLDQLLIEPFHSLQAGIVRHAYEADAILIGGYGFSDVHVNRALGNRIYAHGDRPAVMVLDMANRNTDPMPFRPDSWARNLCAALRATADFFVEPGHSSPAVPMDLSRRGGFEVSSRHRVAIWHGGFNDAARRIDDISAWLSGQPDDVLACT